MSEPTMSQFATREQCLEARVEYYKQQRDELLDALKHSRYVFGLAYSAAEKGFNDEVLLHAGHGGAMANKAIEKAEGGK